MTMQLRLLKFQSALPMKGATKYYLKINGVELKFQSALPMKGATQAWFYGLFREWISIRAPNERSDIQTAVGLRINKYFNPRSQWKERPIAAGISAVWNYFNPRSQWKERPMTWMKAIKSKPFQSALPMKGATAVQYRAFADFLFQSALPMKGATLFFKLFTSY